MRGRIAIDVEGLEENSYIAEPLVPEIVERKMSVDTSDRHTKEFLQALKPTDQEWLKALLEQL